MQNIFLYIFMFQEQSTIALEGIMEPDPIPFTFNTMGWKFVFVLLILTLLFFGYKVLIHYQSQAYRRTAVAYIESLAQDNSLLETEFITKVLFAIKQTALQTYPRNDVAGLQGEAWLAFLDKHNTKSQFCDYQKTIEAAVYQNTYLQESNYNKQTFTHMSIHWIKHHAR